MASFALRLSGLREVVARMGPALGTRNFSSLSHALNRPVGLRYVQTLVERLAARHRPGREALVAIDSMAVTLPATQRHRCARYNDRAVGGGVLWTFAIDAARGSCPVRVLKVMAGAWHDSKQMNGVELIARGPIYLMDRGFYALARIKTWSERGVRFIVRARGDATGEVLRTLSDPRPYRTGSIELDVWMRLGSASQLIHPEARMIRARVGKQMLVLVTGEKRGSAERILEAYRKRERIEQFHRCLKDLIGLAHLYSFSQTGIMFLLYTALLLAMLLILGAASGGGDTVALLRKTLRKLRRSLGLGQPWKRNTFTAKRAKLSRQNLKTIVIKGP